MTEHSITWYEATDGKIFMDEMECCNYELNLLYRESGVTFCINGEKISDLEDDSYDRMTDIFIDRSKETENNALCDFINYNYGWCYVVEALEGDGTRYRFSDSPFEPMVLILGEEEKV